MKNFFPAIFVLFCQVSLGQDDQSLYAEKEPLRHEWSYSGEYGPDHWAELDAEYLPCIGHHQSPVNIIPNRASAIELPIAFHYHPFFPDLLNTGHTLIDRIVEPKALTFRNEDYTLLQFHFHTPSEHHVMDREYPMEIHFVHQSSSGQYAVISVLVEFGKDANPFLAHFLNALPSHVNEHGRSSDQADPIEAFPVHVEAFYFYDGSFTTPPCTEGINWIVMEEPVSATAEQIELIHKILKNDNRPIQELNGRTLFYSKTPVN